MSFGLDAGSGSAAVPPTDSETPATMLGGVSPEPSMTPAADPPAADQGPDPEPSAPPRTKPDPKLCGVCGTQPAKYKCPRCSLPYCSVPCNKQHKENHPPDPPKPEPTTSAPNASRPKPHDTDPYSILLDHQTAFTRLFDKYPSLPTELARIQQTTLPPSSDNPNPFSRIPGLGGNNPNNRNKTPQPWSRDVGLRRGAAALRKARTNPGDVGDGVREYCELVLFLLGKQNKQGEGEGAVERVREEVVREEVGVIERLLREEEG